MYGRIFLGQLSNIMGVFFASCLFVGCKQGSSAMPARTVEESFVSAKQVGLSFNSNGGAAGPSQAIELTACLEGDFLVEQNSKRVHAQSAQSKAEILLRSQGDCDQTLRILTYDEEENLIGDTLKGVKQGELTRVVLDLQKGDAVELSLEESFNCNVNASDDAKRLAKNEDAVKLVLGRCPLNL